MPKQQELFDHGDRSPPDELLRDEEPTYRLFTHGSRTLSDTELVAIVSGQSIAEARALLKDGLRVFARRAWNVPNAKQREHGAAARIAASLELGRRVAMLEAEAPSAPLEPRTFGRRLAIAYGDETREHFGAIFLTTRGAVIAERVLSIGTLTRCTASARDVYRYALAYHAARVIVFHTHPSGNAEPSSHDLSFTERLRRVSSDLDVDVVDHIIVAKQRYYSMREHGHF